MAKSTNAYYVEFIHGLWRGGIRVTERDINNDVRTVCGIIFNKIRECSQYMATVHQIYELFYTATSLPDLIVNLGTAELLPDGPSLPGWFELLYGNGTTDRYYICANTIALYWKTEMQMALAGIYFLSADGRSLVRKEGDTVHVIDITPEAEAAEVAK